MRFTSWLTMVTLLSSLACQREPDVSVNIVFESGLLDRVAEPVEIGFLENPRGDQGEYLDVAADDPSAYTYVSIEGVDLSTDRITLVKPGSVTESVYWVVARSGEADGRRVVARGVEQLLFSNEQVSRETIELKFYCAHEDSSEGDVCADLGSDRSLCLEVGDSVTCEPSRCGDGYVDEGATNPELCDSGLDAEGRAVACLIDCTLAPPVCGDGVVNPGREEGMTMEECDDGNTSNEDNCVEGCALAVCGDGFVNGTIGEMGFPIETCDESTDNEVNNPNDSCDGCQQTRWLSETFMETSFGRDDLSFRRIADFEVDLLGNLYVLDVDMAQVFRVNAVDGSLTHPDVRAELVAGAGDLGASAGGAADDTEQAIQIRLHEPVRIAVDGVGNLYILDHVWDRKLFLLSSRIVKVDTQGLAEVIYQTEFSNNVFATLVTDIAVDGVGAIYLGRGDPVMDSVGRLTVLEPRETGYIEHDWDVPKPDEVVYVDVNSIAYDPFSHALLMTLWEGQTVYRIELGSSTPWGNGDVVFEAVLPDSFCKPYRVEVAQTGETIVTDAPGEEPSVECQSRGNVVVSLGRTGSGGWQLDSVEHLGWDPFATDLDYSVEYFVRFAPFASSLGDNILVSTDDVLGRVTSGSSANAVDIIGGQSECELISARAQNFGRVSDVVGNADGDVLITDATDSRLYVMSIEDDEIFGVEAGQVGCTRVGEDAGDLGLGGVVIESDGHALVIDSCMRQVRRVASSDGESLVEVDGCRPEVIVEVIAGVYGPCSADDCVDGRQARSAIFSRPSHIEIDRTDGENLYVVDEHKVYRMPRNGESEFTGDETLSEVVAIAPLDDGSAAEISGLAFDSENNLYVADQSRGQIWKVTAGADGHPSGEAVVIAGTGVLCEATPDETCGDGGSAIDAGFEDITGIWIDSYDRIHTTDGRRVRRMLEAEGTLAIATVAGKITREPVGSIGDGDVANAVRFGVLGGGSAGTDLSDGYRYYVIDREGALVRGVRRDNNQVWTLAGPINWWGDCAEGDEECTGWLSGPTSVLRYYDLTHGWTWAVPDSIAKRVRGLWYTDMGGLRVETLAGYGAGAGLTEAFCEADCILPVEVSSVAARYSRLLEDPFGIAHDERTGALYVSEQDRAGRVGGPYIHCLDTRQNPMRIAVFAGAGTGSGYGQGAVPRDEAWFDQPAGLSVHEGYLYVADAGNQVIRRIRLHDTTPCIAFGESPGQYSTPFELWAGIPRQRGFLEDDGGDAREAYLNRPLFTAFSSSGVLYFSDAGNHRVRRVNLDHTIETVIGNGQAVTSSDGAPAQDQSVDTPMGLVVDEYGNLFIASRSAVRIVTAGADGEAGPEDSVYTIYAAGEAGGLGSSMGCLSGLALEPDAEGTRIHVLDACRGSWVAIERQ